MILDANLTLSENQAVTATAISENVVEFGATGTVAREGSPLNRNIGAGNEIPMLIQVTEDFAALTSLTISIESADNAALSSNPIVHYTTPAIPLASLKAGYQIPMRWFPDADIKNFVGIRYTVTGTAASAGKLTAAIGTEQ